jgi:hypothetical protein
MLPELPMDDLSFLYAAGELAEAPPLLKAVFSLSAMPPKKLGCPNDPCLVFDWFGGGERRLNFGAGTQDLF